MRCFQKTSLFEMLGIHVTGLNCSCLLLSFIQNSIALFLPSFYKFYAVQVHALAHASQRHSSLNSDHNNANFYS